MTRTLLLGIFMMALGVLQGCAIGYDSILFATKSNMGVDFDTAPPNLEVAISRQEGVIEPVFENGQTVPVMASFSSKANAFSKFFLGVSSTFSTGEAAFTMSKLYNEPTLAKTEASPTYNKVALTKKPVAHNIFGNEKTKYIDLDAENVRPVLFGTDTSLGIKVKWSGATAQYPSAVNVGFKRKEIAIAPLGLSKKGDNSFEIDAPSLLATIDTDLVAESGASLSYLQYFATGQAANNLSRQYPVREAMLKRSDPGQKFQAYRQTVTEQEKEINKVLECYAALKQSDLPNIWNDANNRKLFFDPNSLSKVLGLHTAAMANPAVLEENLRKAHKRYVVELSTTDGKSIDRTSALEAHGKIVCMSAKE